MEQRIETTAEKLFFHYGLKSISMDDIAREAGVSKKTVYQCFKDKNSLVLNIFGKLIREQRDQLRFNLKNSKNAIHEVLLMAENVKTLVQKLRPVVLFDIHKYFPESWNVLKDFREESLREAFANNLVKGISEGLYRKNLDIEVISQFALVQFSSLFKPESYPDTRFKTLSVIDQITELFLYGITSSKGLAVVEKYFENRNNEHKS